MAFRWTGFPAQPPSFGKAEGHFIALLLYSDDAKPAGWFYQEEANKEFALENPILFIAFHDLRLSVSLALHNSIRHGIFYLMFATVVQRSLSKTHVISNHGAKLESKCAVFLRSQKNFWKKWFFCEFQRLRVAFFFCETNLFYMPSVLQSTFICMESLLWSALR